MTKPTEETNTPPPTSKPKRPRKKPAQEPLEHEAQADRALEEVRALRKVVQVLRPFDRNQRSRILAFVSHDLAYVHGELFTEVASVPVDAGEVVE